MRLLNVASILLITLIFSACGYPAYTEYPTQPEPALTQVINEISRQFYEDYGLTFYAFGEGGSETTLDLLILGYEGIYQLGKNAAREMIVDCVLMALNIINNNENLRPILSNQVFGPENLRLTILYYGPDRTPPFEPQIAAVTMSEGTVWYRCHSVNQRYGYSLEEQESFNEALTKVRQQRQDGSAF